MARRGLPLALVLLMLFSLTIGQVAAQSDPDKQPSTERPTMYLWGDAALQSGNCFNHFASDGETQTGFGEYDSTENIEFSCPLDDPLASPLYLDVDGVISFNLGFLIQSSETSDGDDLVLSLTSGMECAGQNRLSHADILIAPWPSPLKLRVRTCPPHASSHSSPSGSAPHTSQEL